MPRVTSVRGYLLTALRNRCLNALRERRVRDEHQDKLLEAQLASGTEEEVVDEEVHRRLHEALDAMPERCREVILLKVVDGLTNREIAARTGVTEGTVKTQVQRAYKFLRDRLLPVNPSLCTSRTKKMTMSSQNSRNWLSMSTVPRTLSCRRLPKKISNKSRNSDLIVCRSASPRHRIHCHTNRLGLALPKDLPCLCSV